MSGLVPWEPRTPLPRTPYHTEASPRRGPMGLGLSGHAAQEDMVAGKVQAQRPFGSFCLGPSRRGQQVPQQHQDICCRLKLVPVLSVCGESIPGGGPWDPLQDELSGEAQVQPWVGAGGNRVQSGVARGSKSHEVQTEGQNRDNGPLAGNGQ